MRGGGPKGLLVASSLSFGVFRQIDGQNDRENQDVVLAFCGFDTVCVRKRDPLLRNGCYHAPIALHSEVVFENAACDVQVVWSWDVYSEAINKWTDQPFAHGGCLFAMAGDVEFGSY